MEEERQPLIEARRASTAGCCGGVKLPLYASHFLSSWGDRMWAFAAGIFLVVLSPGSLRLSAIYGFAKGAAILLSGSLIGDAVDRKPRLAVCVTSLLVQNLSIALSALAVSLTLALRRQIREAWSGLETVCHVIIVAFAVLADVASVGRTVSVERDWAVAIAEDKAELTAMSSSLRRIDLCTKLLAPVLAGQVITYGSPLVGAVFIAVWNVASTAFEYVLLVAAYRRCPRLAADKPRPPDATVARVRGSVWKTSLNGWKVYFRQKIVLAALGLSCVYMTVLGFDNITTSYAKVSGLSESVIGLQMAGAALTGIVGTAFFPLLRSCCGLPVTGVLMFWIFVALLVPCVLSVFLPGSPFELWNVRRDSLVSIWVLMSGIIAARIGLWGSDLTVVQLLIEEPADCERGTVNGVQSSLNQSMDMLKYFLVILIPQVEKFAYLIFVSFFFCVLGAVSFTAYALKHGHGYSNSRKLAEHTESEIAVESPDDHKAADGPEAAEEKC